MGAQPGADDALCARLGVPAPPRCVPRCPPVPHGTWRAPRRPGRPGRPGEAVIGPGCGIDQLADRDPLFQAMARLGLVIGGPRHTDMGCDVRSDLPVGSRAHACGQHRHRVCAGGGALQVPARALQDRTPGEHLQAPARRDAAGGQPRAGDLAQIAGEVEFDVVDPATVPLPDAVTRPSNAERAFFARYVWLGPRDGFWDVERRCWCMTARSTANGRGHCMACCRRWARRASAGVRCRRRRGSCGMPAASMSTG